MKQALTTGDVAKEAATSKKVIRNLIQSGKLKAYRLQRDYRIERSDWEAFKQGNPNQPETSAEERGRSMFEDDMRRKGI